MERGLAIFPTFPGNSVSPGQVSYASLALTGNITLAWPNFQGAGTNIAALVMDITANAGGFSITFPDATAVGNGTTALLRNTGAQTINILANDGSTITTVAAGVAKFLYLQSNATAAGAWGVVTFGTGTSAADASALAGFGLQAINATLNQSHPTTTTSVAITVSATADLAKVYVMTGGSQPINLPSSATAGPNFFVIVKNNGTGTGTITPSGGDVVDTGASVSMSPNDACMICSLGSLNGWVTIGLGRAVAFAFTQLVKSVAGNTDVTLTAAEAANKLITFTGALTGNINVIVPSTQSVYYVFNNTSGAFSLTVKTAAGTGQSIVQGTHDICVCDGTNVYRGVTNTAATTAFGAGSAASPSITFIARTDTGLYSPSAGVAALSGGGFEVMSFNSVASSINWIDVFAAATGTPPSLRANSSADPNVSLQLRPRGAGHIQIADGTDPTKIGQFTASGITTGNTRSVVFPDADTSLPVSAQVLTYTGPSAPRSYAVPDASVDLGVPAGSLIDYCGTVIPANYLACDGSNVARASFPALFAAIMRTATVTITIASPGVINWNAHGLSNGDPVKFTTTGALPTGMTASTTYFVVGAATNSFNIAATEGGAAINLTGTQSGVQTAIHAPWGDGNGTTTFTVPDTRRRSTVNRGGTPTAALGAHLGSTGGEEAHTMLIGELVAHGHPFSGTSSGVSAQHVHNLTANGHTYRWVDVVTLGGGGIGGGTASTADVTATDVNSADHTHSYSGTTSNTGSGTPFNVYHPVAVVTQLIRAY